MAALQEIRSLVIYRDQLARGMTRSPKVLWNLSWLLADRVTQLMDELIAAGVRTEASRAQSLSRPYAHRPEARIRQPEVLPISVTDLSHPLSSSREITHRPPKRLQERRPVKILPRAVWFWIIRNWTSRCPSSAKNEDQKVGRLYMSQAARFFMIYTARLRPGSVPPGNGQSPRG